MEDGGCKQWIVIPRFATESDQPILPIFVCLSRLHPPPPHSSLPSFLSLPPKPRPANQPTNQKEGRPLFSSVDRLALYAAERYVVQGLFWVEVCGFDEGGLIGGMRKVK
jgi:hypothetical protein